MYDKAGVAGAAMGTGGALALTGANVVWISLAGFAMLAAGMAILRIVPRSTRSKG